MVTFLRAIILNIPALALAGPAFAQQFQFDPEGNIPFTNLGELIANAAILLFVAAAVLAFIFIVIGGVQWIAAGGDKLGAAAARDRITAAVVGLVVVVAAFGIIAFICLSYHTTVVSLETDGIGARTAPRSSVATGIADSTCGEGAY